MDNWKLDWNGRAHEAIEYVNQNLAVQAASAERCRQEARRRKLYPIARAAHPAIPQHGRVWSFGEGHVGEAVRSNQLMVSGDVRHTAAWVRSPRTLTDDMRNYVSVMAKPYYRPNGAPGGTVTLTSGRVDHFTKLNASATLAFDTVVSFVNMVLLEE